LTDYRDLGVQPVAPPPVAIRFVDATASSGIDFRHAGPSGEPGRPGASGDGGPAGRAARYGSGLAGGGVAGGGRPQLGFPNASADGRARPALFRNKGGFAFEEVTASSGVDFAGVGTGAVLGDFDNDKDADLYLTRLGGGALFENDGKGHFRDV